MKRYLGSVLVAVAFAAACGGSDHSTPPTSPASQTTTAANAGTGAISGDGTTTGATAATTITGTISGFGGTCPAVSFKLEAKVIKTDASTSFGDGKCSDLKDGVKVGVSGTVQADGSILAKQVKVAPPPLAPPVTVEGTVSALSGTCPKITFTVASKTFTTDSLTRFGDVGCAAVKNDAKVAVVSQVQANGTVRVLTVKVIPPPPPPPVITGTVTSVTGTCPAITITLEAKVAVTSSSTVFDGKACGDVKAGAKVGIYGTYATGSTTLTATKVVIR